MLHKPSFAAMWSNFPDHAQYPTLADLYGMLGGNAPANINSPGFGPVGNTCASRMSVALNRSGALIQPALVSRDRRITVGDGTSIIFRVSDFRQYLVKAFGPPSLDKVSPFDDAFKSKRGIIAFSINFYGGGATGHIALWNGSTYRKPAHDNYSAWSDPYHPDSKTRQGGFWEMLP